MCLYWFQLKKNGHRTSYGKWIYNVLESSENKEDKVIDFAQYMENNRGTNDQYHKTFSCRNIGCRL